MFAAPFSALAIVATSTLSVSTAQAHFDDAFASRYSQVLAVLLRRNEQM